MFGPDKTDKDKETETKEKEEESDPQPTSEDSANQEQPKFGPCPDTSSALTLTFKTELDRIYPSQSTSGRHHSAESSKVAL